MVLLKCTVMQLELLFQKCTLKQKLQTLLFGIRPMSLVDVVIQVTWCPH